MWRSIRSRHSQLKGRHRTQTERRATRPNRNVPFVFSRHDGADLPEAGRRCRRTPPPVSPAPVRRPRTHWIWWPCWLAILAAGVVTKSLQTTTYLFGTRDDDELMVRMAKGFLDGHWSSTWASTGPATLAKPVGYPLVPRRRPLPPVVAGALDIPLLSPRGRADRMELEADSGARSQATIVLAMLTFSPTLFAAYNQSVYRDLFVDALATVAIGLAFVIAAEVQSRHRTATDRFTGQGPPSTQFHYARQVPSIASVSAAGTDRCGRRSGRHHETDIPVARHRRGSSVCLSGGPTAASGPVPSSLTAQDAPGLAVGGVQRFRSRGDHEATEQADLPCRIGGGLLLGCTSPRLEALGRR